MRRTLRPSVTRLCALTADRVPPSAPPGLSHNPRYPRVCANPPSHRSSSPKRQAPRPDLVLLLQARRPPLLLVFSGTEGRTVSLAAVAAEKKRGCPRGSRAHRGHHRRSQDGLKRTISLVSKHLAKAAVVVFVCLMVIFQWVQMLKATRLVPRRTPTATNEDPREFGGSFVILRGLYPHSQGGCGYVSCCCLLLLCYAVTLIALDSYGDCMYYTTRIHRLH